MYLQKIAKPKDAIRINSDYPAPRIMEAAPINPPFSIETKYGTQELKEGERGFLLTSPTGSQNILTLGTSSAADYMICTKDGENLIPLNEYPPIKYYNEEKDEIDRAKSTERWSRDVCIHSPSKEDLDEVKRMDAIYNTLLSQAGTYSPFNIDSNKLFLWEAKEFVTAYAKVKEISPEYEVDSWGWTTVHALNDCKEKLETLKYEMYEYFEERGFINGDDYKGREYNDDTFCLLVKMSARDDIALEFLGELSTKETLSFDELVKAAKEMPDPVPDDKDKTFQRAERGEAR